MQCAKSGIQVEMARREAAQAHRTATLNRSNHEQEMAHRSRVLEALAILLWHPMRVTTQKDDFTHNLQQSPWATHSGTLEVFQQPCG